MKTYIMNNKGQVLHRLFILMLVFLLIIPVNTLAIIKDTRKKPPKKKFIESTFSIQELELIPPDMIDPTIIVNPLDTYYHACDKMPVPLQKITYGIKYNSNIKDPLMYGTVIIHALINEYGEVEKCIVAKEIFAARLVEQLVYSIKHTHFEPAIRDGLAVKVWVGIPVRFKLSNQIIMQGYPRPIQ